MRRWIIWFERPITVMPRFSTRSVRFYRKWEMMDIGYIFPKALVPCITEQRKPFRTYWAETH